MKQDGPPDARLVDDIRFVDTNASVLFDLLRGLAALLVFTSHARFLFLVDFPSVMTHRALMLVPYLLSGAGHQAVVVFFVLSGYFIGGSIVQTVKRKRWLWSDYLLRRLLRLWVVLLPALLLCLLWDRLGMHFGHAPRIYQGLFESASSWWGTAFFLQGILSPIFGTDNALWSVAVEFWYYVTFPLGYLALHPATPRTQRWIYAVLVCGLIWFLRGDVLWYSPIWLAGALLAVVSPPKFAPRTGRRALLFATPAYVLVLFGVSRNRTVLFVGDYVLAVATFGFLWLLLSMRERAEPKALQVRASRELARFSYSLYALHLPLFALAAAFLVSDTRWFPTPLHLLAVGGICVVVLGYAYALASVTEFHTDAVRRRFERVWGLPAPRSILPSDPALKPHN